MMRVSRVRPRLPAQSLRADTGIAYEERSRGILQLFRTQAQLDAAARHRGAGGVRRALRAARR